MTKKLDRVLTETELKKTMEKMFFDKNIKQGLKILEGILTAGLEGYHLSNSEKSEFKKYFKAICWQKANDLIINNKQGKVNNFSGNSDFVIENLEELIMMDYLESVGEYSIN